MCSCHSIQECCVTFSGVKLSIRSFVLLLLLLLFMCCAMFERYIPGIRNIVEFLNENELCEEDLLIVVTQLDKVDET